MNCTSTKGNRWGRPVEQQLSRASSLAEYAVTHDDLEALFAKAVALVAETVPVTYVLLGQLIDGGQAFSLRGSFGLNSEPGSGTASRVNGHRATIFSQFLRRTIVIHSRDRFARAKAANLIDRQDVVQGISVPIRGVGRPWGVLAAYATNGQVFRSLDRLFVRGVATVLGAAIERSHVRAAALVSPNEAERANRDWNSAVDALPQGICLLDSDGAVIRVNKPMQAWCRGKIVALRPLDFKEILSSQCEEACREVGGSWASLKRRLVGGTRLQWEFECPHDSGRLRFCLQRLPVRTTHGRSNSEAYAVLTVEHVTQQHCSEPVRCDYNENLQAEIRQRTERLMLERRELEEQVAQHEREKQALRDREQRFHLAMAGANEGLWDWDVEANSVYYSSRWKGMLGYAEDEVQGHFDEWRTRVHPHDLDRAMAAVRAIVSRATESYENVHRLRHKDGTYRWILARGRPLTNQSGEVRRIVGTHVDITEIKEANRKLRALSGQLIDAQERERQRIAAELHDSLGQTLSTIKLRVESCLSQGSRRLSGHERQAIDTTLERIGEAVDEVRRIAMDLRPVMLDDLGVVATLQWFCREFQNVHPGVKVIQRFGVDEHAIPQRRKVAIYRIVQEAFNNAAKHAQASNLVVVLSNAETGIELSIKDDGCGFDVTRSASGEWDAPGFGLRSMRERAELTDGAFCLVSNPGEGTAIAVRWPAEVPALAGC